MGVKEDVLRALQYGTTAYYQAITQVPSYQAELARVRTDYNERTWIDFTGFFPKFTTEQFNKLRDKYQAKYGTSINIPGFQDVIHLIPKARISAEQRAAHLWAKKRGLPSPLTPDQLETMKYKKYRFLKALQSPTPTWMKNIGAVAETLDNVEDGLITIAVMGRIAAKLAPRLFGRLLPGIGWVLVGSDILNLVNMASWISFSAQGGKRITERLAERNPFHAKAKARRTLKLRRTVPTFGEFLEIAQTTDQLFGVGLCLGGLVGLLTDTASTAFDPNYWKQLDQTLRSGNVHEISDWAQRAAMNDYNMIKWALQQQFSQLKDEAYRLKAIDEELRKAIHDWLKTKTNETWGWIKTKPEAAWSWFSDTIIGSMIISTGKDDFLKADHTKAYIMLDTSIRGLMPWWIENDPLANFPQLRTWKFRAPAPKDPTTTDILTETSPGWEATVRWPWLEKEYATIEEIAFTYAPMIKDSFQTYALEHAKEYEAMIAAEQVVEFTKDVIRSFSDDNEVVVGMTAWWAVAEDMTRDVYLLPPDTPADQISSLGDYIGNYERQTAVAPPINDVVQYGKSIGIDWMRTYPAKTLRQAGELFPEWFQIQQELEDIYIID